MYLVKPPHIIRKLSEKYIHWQVKTNEKVLYFTFDDGPIPELTPKALKILDKYNAKATFFMVADNVRKHPDVYQQVMDAGHAIGNHSYNHVKGWKLSNEEYYSNIAKASDLLNTKLFRPPYGQISPSQAKHLAKDYNIIMWSVLSGDYDKNTSPEQCFNNILRKAKNGSIIVMHDNLKAEENMLFALEESLKHFSQLGYRFDSLANIYE
ncbi:MAG: polysaccharide deacetylase family protein [Bacteroidetes bacterium 4572_112]|nr:MAG: polysaccharide deacetylase family protein [Bacteroidetes bacterium 4572_112]